MNPKLRRDPIVEATCTIRFNSKEWDWTVAGLLWSRLKEIYPVKQQADLVSQDAPDDLDQPLGVTQFNFWRRDKTGFVRIEPNQLSIVQLAPYTGWPRFKQNIHEVVNHYRQVEPSGTIENIAIRYLNRIPVPEDEFDIREYLNLYPEVPVSGDFLLGPWLYQSQIMKPAANVRFSITAGLLFAEPSESDEFSSVVVLDIRANPNQVQDIGGQEFDWIERAHEEVESFFFACLTPKYLQTLEPEENHAKA